MSSDRISLFLLPDGTIEGIYSDEIDYSLFGEPSIRRASHVEWDEESKSWGVTFIDGNQKVTGFSKRSDALAFEVDMIERRMISDDHRSSE